MAIQIGGWTVTMSIKPILSGYLNSAEKVVLDYVVSCFSSICTDIEVPAIYFTRFMENWTLMSHPIQHGPPEINPQRVRLVLSTIFQTEWAHWEHNCCCTKSKPTDCFEHFRNSWFTFSYLTLPIFCIIFLYIKSTLTVFFIFHYIVNYHHTSTSSIISSSPASSMASRICCISRAE